MNRLFWTSILTLAFCSTAYCDWEPEVLLHRQGDRLGWFYEKVEGLGDWTGDGIDDFAVLTGTLAIDLWWGGASLSLDPDTTIYRPDSSYFYNFKRTGDLTGDGISEFAVACWDHLLVYRGGRGQVEVLQVLQVPQIHFTDMAIPGDISGDGLPDLVLGSYNDSKVMVYLGTPTGFEGPVETLDGIGHHLGGELTAGADMNGDGWGDFACYFNTRDSTFVLFHPHPEDYLGNRKIFKGHRAALVPRAYQSGRPALVLGYYGGYLNPVDFRIHLGGQELDTIPDATLTLGDLFWASLPTHAGDVNGDGWEDWLAGSHDNYGYLGAFVLFLGGPWISNYTYWHGGFTGYWGEGIHLNGVGDVNGDGIDDFAIICNDDTTGHHQYGQIVVFAGDEGWHVAVDDRRTAPLRSTVTIQAYPNPSNAQTRIVIEGLRPGEALELKIYNVLGQEVVRLHEQARSKQFSFDWNAAPVSAGVYFCQVRTTSDSQTMKLLVTP